MACEPSPDVLVFDLGGVLVDFAGFDELSLLARGHPERDAVRSRWIASAAVQRFERGAGSDREFAQGVIREFRLSLSVEEFIPSFVSWARGPYAGARELLQSLRTAYRLACLSNSNRLHTPIHRRDIGGLVDRCYFSDELGAVKPEPEIFQRVIDDLETAPARIAFFDDTPVNVEAAREAGMQAWEVQGVEGLRVRLRSLGLL